MTIVVGIIDKKMHRVYMGGDFSISNGPQVRETTHRKVYFLGNFLIGFAGVEYLNQLIEFHFTPPEIGYTPFRKYMVTEFVPELRKVFEKNGYKEPDLNKDPGEFELLVAYNAEMCEIGCDFSVVSHVGDYDAIGSGAKYALGALRALEQVGMPDSIAHCVTIAMVAASHFDARCTDNRIVLHTGGGDVPE